MLRRAGLFSHFDFKKYKAPLFDASAKSHQPPPICNNPTSRCSFLCPDPAPPFLPSLSQMLHISMPRSKSKDSTQKQPKWHCLRSSFGPLVHIDTFLVCGELGNHRSVNVAQLEKDSCSKSCSADERSALKLKFHRNRGRRAFKGQISACGGPAEMMWNHP
jgi:hypothetical protein